MFLSYHFFSAECKADILFLLDRSGSICEAMEPGGATSWEYVLDFTVAMVNTLDVAPEAAQVALVLFGNFGYVQFSFGNFNSSQEIMDFIRAIDCKAENTNTTGGLRVARTEVFSSAGDRPDAENIIVMVTDGQPNREVEELPGEIANLAAADIKLIAIGTGDANEIFLETLVVSPEDYFFILDFPGLAQIAEVVTLVACGGLRPTEAGLRYLYFSARFVFTGGLAILTYIKARS